MKWTKNRERNQKIIELFHEKKSTRAVADLMNMSVTMVHHTLRRHGVDTTQYGKRSFPYSICDQNAELILSLYAERVPMNEIGRRMKAKPQQVKKLLERRGVEIRQWQAVAGPDHPNWKGGRVVDAAGYIQILKKDHPYAKKHTGYVQEHRLVMEAHLGRYLSPKEVVHHIDSNPQNNKIENLQVFASNAEHLAFELKGRIPQWTPEGRANILAANRLRKGTRHASTLARLAACGQPCI